MKLFFFVLLIPGQSKKMGVGLGISTGNRDFMEEMMVYHKQVGGSSMMGSGVR